MHRKRLIAQIAKTEAVRYHFNEYFGGAAIF
jgi:hypothetical protein